MEEHVADSTMIIQQEDEVITLSDDDEKTVPTEKSSGELAEAKRDEGNRYFKVKEYYEAINCYTSAINLQPDVAAYYGNRSACYLMLDRYKEALEDANKSVTLDPNFIKGYVRIVKCVIALGDFPGASRVIDVLKSKGEFAAVSAEATTLDLILRFKEDADISYEKGDFRRVIFCMDRIMANGCSAAVFKIRKAECLAYLKRFQEAQELANSVIQFDKQNADAIYVRGLCLYYEDNIDQAFMHFKRALQFAPDHKNVHNIYKKAKALKQKKDDGNEAFKSGRYQDALNLYNEALLIDPDNTLNLAKLYFNRATVLAKLGKLQESVSDCTAALKIDEKYLKALLRRAKCYMELSDYEEAVRDYEAACKMDANRENKRLLHEAKLELKKSKRKDYYKILGISKTASTEEIKKAYRKRALIHHPDRHANASEVERLAQEKQFKEVGEAYGVLSDPKKRARYDNGQDLEDMDGMADFDPNSMFRAFFSGQGGEGFTFHSSGGFPSGFTFQFG